MSFVLACLREFDKASAMHYSDEVCKSWAILSMLINLDDRVNSDGSCIWLSSQTP